jgi:hypothetical protein
VPTRSARAPGFNKSRRTLEELDDRHRKKRWNDALARKEVNEKRPIGKRRGSVPARRRDDAFSEGATLAETPPCLVTCAAPDRVNHTFYDALISVMKCLISKRFSRDDA